MNVIPGEYSPPDKMGYSWKVIKMTERYLELQMDFKRPMYISIEEDYPEMLEIIIADDSLFMSSDGMPLDLIRTSARELQFST